jgi:hypothetical protein
MQVPPPIVTERWRRRDYSVTSPSPAVPARTSSLGPSPPPRTHLLAAPGVAMAQNGDAVIRGTLAEVLRCARSGQQVGSVIARSLRDASIMGRKSCATVGAPAYPPRSPGGGSDAANASCLARGITLGARRERSAAERRMQACSCSCPTRPVELERRHRHGTSDDSARYVSRRTRRIRPRCQGAEEVAVRRRVLTSRLRL